MALRRLPLLLRRRFRLSPPAPSKHWIAGTIHRRFLRISPHIAAASTVGRHPSMNWTSRGLSVSVGAAEARKEPEGGGGFVDVPLAQTGEGIAECELLRWFVAEGDAVEEFQRLCEVQSDKATIEITSRFKGRIHSINYVPGEIVKVGETLLKMTVGDSEVESSANEAFASNEHCGEDGQSSSVQEGICAEVLATPAVRHLAKQHGINLHDIRGTGVNGRVLKEDVLKYVSISCEFDSSMGATSLQSKPLDRWSYEDTKIPIRGFHRAMVKSMTLAAKVPHFHYLEEINCDALIRLKASFSDANKDANVKHTFLPFLVKSLSLALSSYPLLNSSFVEETNEILLKGCHNIGVAMATSYGLVVPNIKRVQSLSILEITKELSRLHDKASHNKLDIEDISDGTVTLSNIGAIGSKVGSPLLNLPEVAIIALGRIQKVPRFGDDGNIHPAHIVNVNVGADHRVVDGATVAMFCNAWKSFIEKPELLLLHMR